MDGKFRDHLAAELKSIEEHGLTKRERILKTPQGVEIRTDSGARVLNFCANNYLGLCNEPRVMAGANHAFFRWGFGMASVRFICGTQELHKELERQMAEFLGMDDAILYSSAFDANGGVFEPLLDERDAIISDELNHASIIDGVRLAKAKRFVYKNNEVDRICGLAERYGALVLVDDSHATGFIGPNGRGTHEHCGVMDKVDIIVTTFGKALGGASGGCIAGRREIVDMLRQRSRPYLFSNSLAPAIAGGTLEVLKILGESNELRERLMANTRVFRKGMEDSGFRIIPGVHPIVPVCLGHMPDDAKLSQDFANALLEEGIYVIGFFYPVVPVGRSRIRVQISAAHTPEQIDFALQKFRKVGKRFRAI
jgi:glycine C-acetyltransferase